MTSVIVQGRIESGTMTALLGARYNTQPLFPTLQRNLYVLVVAERAHCLPLYLKDYGEMCRVKFVSMERS